MSRTYQGRRLYFSYETSLTCSISKSTIAILPLSAFAGVLMAFLVSTLLLRSRLHSQAASPGSWSTSYSGLRQMYNGASVVLSIAGLIYLLQAPGYRRGIALIQSATRTSARSLMARGLGFVDEPIQRLHDTSGFISGARSIGAGLAGNFEKPQCYPFVLNTTSVIVYRQGSLFGILTPMH